MDDDFASLTDDQLRAMEESMYDSAVETGDPDGNLWHARDEVLWEMNRRGLCGAQI